MYWKLKRFTKLKKQKQYISENDKRRKIIKTVGNCAVWQKKVMSEFSYSLLQTLFKIRWKYCIQKEQ